MAAHTEQLLRHVRGLVPWAVTDSAPDSELLDRFVRCRDESAFAALVARHGPMVLGVCRRALRNADLAEDVAQAFLAQALALKTTGDVRTVDGGNIAAALR